MIVHVSDRSKYRKSDSYAKKMSYTTSTFGCDYGDFLRIKSDPYIKSKYVVWFTNRNKQKERR